MANLLCHSTEPTSFSPLSLKATTDGVVFPPSEFGITFGSPPSTMATHELVVVNSYTQYNYGKNHTDGVSKPLDYEALTMCMRKINHTFKGKRIGLPQIGAGLAGGDGSAGRDSARN